MAARSPAQAKLNHVVQIIGEALDSEVCSIYLLRDGVLELYATRGLKQEAVHVTKLALGEGLVGTIAEEVETRTLPYLLLRPTGRLGLTLGKYLSGAALSFVLLASGVLVLHAGAYATEPSAMIEGLDETLRMIGALALLTLCYSAICLFWGSLITEASGLMSTLHLGALEFAMGMMPFALRFMSMNYWATQIAGLPKGGFLVDTVPDVELWIATTVITVVTFLFLGGAALVVRTSQFGFGKA